MERVSTIGLDLAKNVSQVHGADKTGRKVLKKRLNRAKVLTFFANLPACLVGIEACSGSNYWAREIEKLGHEVKVMAPQFVKPYVNDKTDENDAEAICEAVTRPNMRFVGSKTAQQQDIQAIHRIRERLVKSRTALINEARGLLGEYGIVMGRSRGRFARELPLILADENNGLSPLIRRIFEKLMSEYHVINEEVLFYESQLDQICKVHPEVQRLMKISGIGKITATAIVSSVSANVFKNGREFAAWLGLTPKQHSSGGKQTLLGISKRGNNYIRKLLIHGASASLRWLKTETMDKRSCWCRKLMAAKGKNRAAVALANKNARIAWALLAKQEEYRLAI